MFLSRNKKNNVYPCKPQFYYIKVGFKGVKIILACFRDGCSRISSVIDMSGVNDFALFIRNRLLTCCRPNSLFTEASNRLCIRKDYSVP